LQYWSVQSELIEQVTPRSHATQTPPQSIAVSFWLMTLSKQVGSAQRLALQKSLLQSPSTVQLAPEMQRSHSLLPPQSASDSFASFASFWQTSTGPAPARPAPPLPLPLLLVLPLPLLLLPIPATEFPLPEEATVAEYSAESESRSGAQAEARYNASEQGTNTLKTEFIGLVF